MQSGINKGTTTRLILMTIILFSVVWSLAEAQNYGIMWLDMSTVPIDGTVPSGSVFNLPGYGNVMITYTSTLTPLPWHGQYPDAQNGWLPYGGHTYSWTTFDHLSQTNFTFSEVTYTVTYTFQGSIGPVPSGMLALGVYGLGRINEPDPDLISTITVYNNGTHIGDWDLLYNAISGKDFGPTSVTGNNPFVLQNSLTGSGQPGAPEFNTDLAVILIDDNVNTLTLNVNHIGQDGFGFNVGLVDTLDAWMQDVDPCDNGNEPDPCPTGTYMWVSEDIRITHYPTVGGVFPSQHENPTAYENNYVYVKLRNRGNVPVTGDLKVYWADASSGLSWNATAETFATSPSGLIGSQLVTVPETAPREVIAMFPWTPSAAGHVCALARFVSNADPMAQDEIADVRLNTWRNNNIVWKNLLVVYPCLAAPPDGDVFLVRNVKPSITIIDLELNAMGGGGGVPFTDSGTVEVALTQEMFDNWMGAGAQGEGITVDPVTATILLTGPMARIQGIPMAGDEAQPVEMFFALNEDGAPACQRFVVSQYSDGQADPDGGVTFEFRYTTESEIPTLTEWGIIIFTVLLLGWMAWAIVRRRNKATVGF